MTSDAVYVSLTRSEWNETVFWIVFFTSISTAMLCLLSKNTLRAWFDPIARAERRQIQRVRRRVLYYTTQGFEVNQAHRLADEEIELEQKQLLKEHRATQNLLHTLK